MSMTQAEATISMPDWRVWVCVLLFVCVCLSDTVFLLSGNFAVTT